LGHSKTVSGSAAGRWAEAIPTARDIATSANTGRILAAAFFLK
jgi:hypothetical protein